MDGRYTLLLHLFAVSLLVHGGLIVFMAFVGFVETTVEINKKWSSSWYLLFWYDENIYAQIRALSQVKSTSEKKTKWWERTKTSTGTGGES